MLIARIHHVLLALSLSLPLPSAEIVNLSPRSLEEESRHLSIRVPRGTELSRKSDRFFSTGEISRVNEISKRAFPFFIVTSLFSFN